MLRLEAMHGVAVRRLPVPPPGAPSAAFPPLSDRDRALVRESWNVLVPRRNEAITALLARLSPPSGETEASQRPGAGARGVRRLLVLIGRAIRSSDPIAGGFAPIQLPAGFAEAALATLHSLLGDRLTPAAFLAWRRFLRALATPAQADEQSAVPPHGIAWRPATPAAPHPERAELFESWARLQFVAMEAAELFFAQLFACDDRYLRLFENHPATRRHQVLMGVLGVLVANERQTRFLSEPGLRHWAFASARWGLTTADYDRAIRVLLSSFAAVLGPEFSRPAHSAWAALLGRAVTDLAPTVEDGSTPQLVSRP